MERQIEHGGRDLSITGVIELDGRRHRVCLPLPLLIQDGFLFFGNLATKYFEEAEKSKASVARLQSQASSILDAMSGLIEKSTSDVANIRLSLTPLVVTESQYTSWCRALLSVSKKAVREDKISFTLSASGLSVCSSLFWLNDYTSACPFKVNTRLSACTVQVLA